MINVSNFGQKVKDYSLHLWQDIKEFFPFYFQGCCILVILVLISKSIDQNRIKLTFLYII